jgi:integrase/recombinase XerD
MIKQGRDMEITILNTQNLTNHNRIVNKKEIRHYLTKDEINQRLNLLSGGRDKMLIQTLWESGLRVSEIVNIKVSDIDFTKRRMIIRWLKNRRHKERIIPIHPNLCDKLQLYSSNMLKNTLIFPISRIMVFNICRKKFNCNPHMLRHSFAVNFLEQYNHPKALIILKELLGHKNIQTTMEYLRLVPSDLEMAINEIKFN